MDPAFFIVRLVQIRIRLAQFKPSSKEYSWSEQILPKNSQLELSTCQTSRSTFFPLLGALMYFPAPHAHRHSPSLSITLYYLTAINVACIPHWPLLAVRDLTREGRWSTYNVSVLKLSNVSFQGKCARIGNTLKLPSPTKLAWLGPFPPVSQAGRLAGQVFHVYVFSLIACVVKISSLVYQWHHKKWQLTI
jgi:hypothetical protein